ncbi:MAG: hypothetical protein C0483_08310 [Pirellula sp.]|nr:hypothetical protein [Pirellula sp.]
MDDDPRLAPEGTCRRRDVNDEQHRLIKDIFLECSKLEGEQRRQCVERRCGDDAAMRREVELLLAHHKSSTIMPASNRDSNPSKTGSRSSNRSRSRGSRTRTAWRRAINQWADRLSVSGQMALGAAATLLLVFGMAWWSQHSIAMSSRNYWANGFASMLKTTDENLTAWFDSERFAVEAWSAQPEFRDEMEKLLSAIPPAAANNAGLTELSAPQEAAPTGAHDPIPKSIRDRARHDAVAVVWNADGKVVIGESTAREGLTSFAAGERFREALAGKSSILLPHQCEAFAGSQWCGAGKPVMGILAPIRGESKSIGVIFVAAPSMISEFTRRLNSITLLSSGDAFAFDKSGRMLTESRYRDELVEAGILKGENPTTVLMLVRDPQRDIRKSTAAEIPYEANYPTLAVTRALGGVDGVEVDGYRDYRGVDVIGGWHWMPQHDFGIVIKLDLDEAYDQLDNLRVLFYVRMLLMVGVMMLLLYSWRSSILARRRIAETPRIGPYVLDIAIGEGGMGRVYRAHHALLKRPTAVKVIKPELVNEQTTAWFEREVTLAGKLTHPNTIEIYDFGSTEEGQFYCAMELLRGLTLSQVLLIEGVLPLPRALYVLKQAAASLAEAHEMGLVHRDIKLHNLMLCFLGGEADFLKVLDFGLAKQFESEGDVQHTASSFHVAGTPLFMAPERLKPPYNADARSDVYALGVVAFKLLTGRDPFTATTDLEMFNHALHTPPPRASSVAQQPIPPELDDLILSCLAKSPDDRPRDAAEVAERLEELCAKHPWRQSEAQGWWLANRQRIRDLAPDWDARGYSGMLRAAGSKTAQSTSPSSNL